MYLINFELIWNNILYCFPLCKTKTLWFIKRNFILNFILNMILETKINIMLKHRSALNRSVDFPNEKTFYTNINTNPAFIFNYKTYENPWIDTSYIFWKVFETDLRIQALLVITITKTLEFFPNVFHWIQQIQWQKFMTLKGLEPAAQPPLV